jgi:hypothetical protein
MFSQIGAFGTFGAFFAVSGWIEIEHIVELIEHRTMPLIQNTQAEVIGRALSITLQALMAIACEGLLVDSAESGL